MVLVRVRTGVLFKIVFDAVVKCLGVKPRGFLFPRRALQIP